MSESEGIFVCKCVSVCVPADPSSVMRLLVDRPGSSSRQEKKAAAGLKAYNLLAPNHHQQSQEHLLLLLLRPRGHTLLHVGPQGAGKTHHEPGHTRKHQETRSVTDPPMGCDLLHNLV